MTGSRGGARQQPNAARTTRGAASARTPATARAGKPAVGAAARPAAGRAARPARTTPRAQARPTAVARSSGTVQRRVVPPRPPRAASPEKRQRWLTVIAALVVAVFIGRLVQVQVFMAPDLAAEARSLRTTTVVEPAHRGEITDRNGVVLATSVDRYTVSADPKAVQSFRAYGRTDADDHPVADGALGVAQLLAPVLGTNKAELAAKINGTSRYVLLARNVEPEKQREIRALNLQAYIRTELVSKRVYPAGSVAGTLVGFVDDEQKGQGGLEKAYDAVLAGTAGKVTYERSLDGVRIPGAEQDSTLAVPGGDVVLTIDHDVQWKAESAINDMVSKSGAAYGIVLVEDAKTGEMLAIADSGSADPNDRSTASVAKGSRAVQDVFEPGSTGKVVTMAAALESGAWTPGSQFTVPYMFTTPNGQTFRDSHDHPVEQLTLAGVLAQSSNSGTVQIAEKIPPQVQYDYMHKFGFGQTTGLGLPGESRGILHPADQWDGRTRYTVAFGQGVSVNAMQATGVFTTVANGGVSVPPTLVKGTRTPGGDLEPTSTAAGSRVISEETAATLLHMLEEVTGEDGTAQAAQIPGYRVAGKTGTAQIFLPSGGYTYMASFIGVAPADNPRYTVSVFLKSPHSSIFGGVVAAPVFRDVMSFVLQKEAVPPSEPAPEPLPLTW
ncbi:penicillin-binding protein 2 [Xylanimonas allomyrinae]|uniref:Penicillin-binding protein 2 n=1 Tax=Xylanimonas allomyrinae TaxID=2509459 RepID=A0A4P6EJ36_9MICO|nr:penicillin-binding protein 2 [Xylanimonas allomyrinae]QAY62335.1 penicillin-binding protein 2 [Xylanimonas allomyrinae]